MKFRSVNDATRPSLVARVTVLQGFQPGEVYDVVRFPAVLGRGAEADVRLQDDPDDVTLSRRHARLSIAGGRLRLQDLSTNGTTVAGKMLAAEEQSALNDLEEVWLGPRTLIQIETLRTGPSPPPPERVAAPTGGVGLEIRALGGFQACLGGDPVPESAWETRKPILLLTYLAYQGTRPVGPDRLCSDLWPDSAQGGRQALQSTLARLRRALKQGRQGLDPVLFERGAYRLNPALQPEFDVQTMLAQRQRARSQPEQRLQALSQVQQLYRGAFLEGYSEDWACVRRQELEQQFHESMAELGASLVELGRSQEAVDLYRAVLLQEPCWELGHQGILRALLELGQRDEAVRHYHRYVETLKSQLGLSPSPDMLRLYYGLLQG